MKRLAFVLASLGLSCSPLMAKTYTVSQAGDRWLVTPALFNVRLQAWDAQPKPNCTELFTSLQRNAATIDRCLPGASQPATACKLLKTVLPKAIFGVDDPTTGVADDVEQYFEVVQADFDAIPDLVSIASSEGLPLAKLALVTQSPWPASLKQQDVKIVGGTASYLPKLVQLDYLKNEIAQIAVGTDGTYGVRDRVSYCELLGGQSQLQGQGNYKTQVKFPISLAALEWSFSLYQRLATLSYPLPGTLEQQALTIGYEMGQYSIEHPLATDEASPALELYRAFFEKSGSNLKLKSLTKTQIQQTLAVTLEADLVTHFQSHN